MSYTASNVIAIAKAEVGYLEKKSNSKLDDKTANAGSGNYTKYARDLYKAGYYNGNKNGFAWCDVFVDWCFYMLCGKDAKKANDMICQTGGLGAACGYSANYYKNQDRFYKSNPIPGDQIFFWNSGKSAVAHTGIVSAVDSTYVYTVEGNTSGASGVVANGGGVCEKKYKLSYSRIYGYGRPKFDQEDSAPEPAPAPTPTPTKEILEVDGKWGKVTTTRLQLIFGTPVDGVVSNQRKVYQRNNPGLVSGWEWEVKPNGNGSALIKAMQKWAGLPEKDQDGEIGPQTIRAFQRKLGTPVDGYVSNPSGMVKALQKWCNEQ